LIKPLEATTPKERPIGFHFPARTRRASEGPRERTKKSHSSLPTHISRGRENAENGGSSSLVAADAIAAAAAQPSPSKNNNKYSGQVKRKVESKNPKARSSVDGLSLERRKKQVKLKLERQTVKEHCPISLPRAGNAAGNDDRHKLRRPLLALSQQLDSLKCGRGRRPRVEEEELGRPI